MADQPPKGRRRRGRVRGRADPDPVAPAAGAPQNVGDVAANVGRPAVGRGGNKSENGNRGSSVLKEHGTVRHSRDSGSALVTTPQKTTTKQGTEGTQVQLTANYFRLSKIKDRSLFEHRVDFEPEVDRIFVKKRLLANHKELLQGYLLDGSTLIAFVNVCPDGNPREFVSHYRAGYGDDGKEILRDYRLTLRFVGMMEPSSDSRHLQLFNIILRECMEKMNLKLICRDYFRINEKVRVPKYGLHLYPGYSTSFVQCETDIMLQVGITHKITRRDTVYETFGRIFNPISFNTADQKDAAKAAVVDCVVMTVYNKKTYRIDDIDFSKTPKHTFSIRKKGKTTDVRFADYYKGKYSLVCKDLNQPMLVSRSNAGEHRAAGLPELVYLVPEFCIFVGLTDDMRTDFRLMRTVNAITCLEPSEHIQRLEDFNKNLNSTPAVTDKLNSWGLKLEPELIQVPGKIIPSQTIHVDGGTYDAGTGANWDRSLRTNHILHSVNIDQWVIIIPSHYSREVWRFYDCLHRAANSMNYKIARPYLCEIDGDGPADFVGGIIEAVNQYNPQLVMCIVPNMNVDRYSAIKQHCILNKPIPSQVVLRKNIADWKTMSIATKIVVQMNCKMGGAPWGVPLLPREKSLMVIGYSMCRDPHDKRRSFGAMVSSMDSNCLRWYSNVTHHSAGEELSINFALNVKKSVEMRQQVGPLPEIVIIYRDGLGKGQTDDDASKEIQKVKEELESLYKAAEKILRIAFVIVRKRTVTRIFHNGSNPLPGTVVGSCITCPFRYNFFLISQSVNRGTVTPTYYDVIEDTTGMPPDIMQRLTYRMTHLYFNWSGTIRVPAPCQYAHKLASLTAQSIFQVHSSDLNQLLYFL